MGVNQMMQVCSCQSHFYTITYMLSSEISTVKYLIHVLACGCQRSPNAAVSNTLLSCVLEVTLITDSSTYNMSAVQRNDLLFTFHVF